MNNPAFASALEAIVLNDVQKEAVAWDQGPQLVFAGAGTGKTRVLTAKIAFLIQDKKIYPNHIFAATFTNKAAREMRERVEAFIGIPCEGLWIGTFHSLCARILRKEAARMGYTSSFSIYDRDDQIRQVRKVLKEEELDEKSMPPRQVLHRISGLKSRCITPEEYDQAANNFLERQFSTVYTTYCKQLKKQNAMDFDDLLANTVYLFRSHADVLEAYRTYFHYVLVDEYQDTNIAQFKLVQRLVGNRGNIFVVGDDDQSIYGWRGAHIENILNFERRFPGTRVCKLEQNYRSTQLILDFANALISHNTNRSDKSLWTAAGGKDKCKLICYRDDRNEADGVARHIQELNKAGMSYGTMCVLFRTNAQSRVFEDVFRRAGIAYVLVGSVSFYERKEIKDCLAFLRLLVNPQDDICFERIMNVPARGLGDKAKEQLMLLALARKCSLLQALLAHDADAFTGRARKGFAQLRELFASALEFYRDAVAPDAMLEYVLKESGYLDMYESEGSEEAESRIENVNELLNTLAIWHEENSGKGLADFLEEISLVTDVDKWNRQDESVNLMTMHCAKGLEFETVFLVGLEDGLLPSQQNIDDPAKLEEERRLLYVGATRAMKKLFCSYVEQRFRFGSIMPMLPSRFLDDIPKSVYEFEQIDLYTTVAAFGQQPQAKTIPQKSRTVPGAGAAPKYEDYSQDDVHYRMGQYVVHKTYGQGRIVNLSGFGADLRLTVLFQDGSRKKLIARLAKLELA
ncbi:MAG: AAA family ATPase [Chitinivibrionales bacterium]|nr:AAA family ATPase [Chitinivibrionales bacterium]